VAKLEAMGGQYFPLLARSREELDPITNRLVIRGMGNFTLMPVVFDQKKKWFYKMVGDVLNRIKSGVAFTIMCANQRRKNSKEIPMPEVKMYIEFRKKFAEMKRTGTDLGRLYISNSVSLATRLRRDILKAVIKRNEKEEEDWHVDQF
jgi:hypothetical protein